MKATSVCSGRDGINAGQRWPKDGDRMLTRKRAMEE